MMHNKIPILTLTVVLIASLLTLVPFQSALIFDRQMVQHGAIWQLFSAHLVHGDLAHLGWNLLGFGVIGSMLEVISRRAWLYSMCFGLVALNSFLVSSLSTVQFYCGFSGLLNTFLFVLLWQLWRRESSPMILVVTVVASAKILFELGAGTSLLTEISWPPYPEAHLVGFVGAAAYVASALLIERKSTGCQSCLKEIRRLEP